MGAGEKISRYATEYYRIMMAGCVFPVVGLCTSALVRAGGAFRYSVKVTGIAVLFNFIFNPFLIKTMNWGVKGSACATLLSMAIYCVLNIRFLAKSGSRLRAGVIDKTIVVAILSVGLSAMLMQVNAFVRQLLLFKVLSHYANEHQTVFFAAVYRIFSFCIVPVFGMLQALQSVVGINYGAHNYTRSLDALSTFRRGAILLMLLPALIFFIFPGSLLSLLLPDESFSAGELWNFRLVLLLLPLAPVASTTIVFLQATGTRKLTAFLTAGRELFLFIPLILLFTYFDGADGIYYSLLTEAVIYTLVMLWVMQRQVHKLKTLQKAQGAGALAAT